MVDISTLPKDWIVTSGQFTRKAYNDLYPAIDPIKPENSLKGKIVVITGASRGLGARSIAPAFVKAGVKAVILIATNASKLSTVEEQLRKINPDLETLALGADISSVEQVAKAWMEIDSRYPKVHVLVNNAGVECTENDKMMHEQNPDLFFKNFEVNVKGTHIVTQQFLQAALHWDTASDKARIVTITSSTAWGVWPFLAGYSMSKAANIMYTTTLAAAYPEKLLAVAVNPGLNDTDIVPDSLREVGFNFNKPGLTGGTIVWLVADPDRSQFLNGRAITSEWDVQEMVERKDEIVSRNLLTMQLQARLGVDQFAD